MEAVPSFVASAAVRLDRGRALAAAEASFPAVAWLLFLTLKTLGSEGLTEGEEFVEDWSIS